MTSLVEVTRGRDGLARVALSRAEKRNALSGALIDALTQAVAELSRDEALRCVARDHRLALSEPDADFFTLIDRARDHVRAGDLDSAEVALHLALSLRPGDRLARQNLRRLLALASNSRLERKSR